MDRPGYQSKVPTPILERSTPTTTESQPDTGILLYSPLFKRFRSSCPIIMSLFSCSHESAGLWGPSQTLGSDVAVEQQSTSTDIPTATYILRPDAQIIGALDDEKADDPPLSDDQMT